MNKKDCLFCQIVQGEIESAKIYEDNNYLAFLDINPNMKGMTLIIPKNHHDSDIFKMNDDEYTKLLIIAKKIAKMLEKGLGVFRVAMVVEGMGVDHVHVKLYPLHGLDSKFKETWYKKRIYFSNYEGYLSTQLGPKKNMKELKKIAQEIERKMN